MSEFKFEVQSNPHTSLPDIVRFVQEENRTLIYRACSDMEDVHSMAAKDYPIFLESIEESTSTQILSAVRSAVEAGRENQVVAAFQKLGKVEFSEIY
jgi:hypothetical protein